jgi:hypothetical protein
MFVCYELDMYLSRVVNAPRPCRSPARSADDNAAAPLFPKLDRLCSLPSSPTGVLRTFVNYPHSRSIR